MRDPVPLDYASSREPARVADPRRMFYLVLPLTLSLVVFVTLSALPSDVFNRFFLVDHFFRGSLTTAVWFIFPGPILGIFLAMALREVFRSGGSRALRLALAYNALVALIALLLIALFLDRMLREEILKRFI